MEYNGTIGGDINVVGVKWRATVGGHILRDSFIINGAPWGMLNYAPGEHLIAFGLNDY